MARRKQPKKKKFIGLPKNRSIKLPKKLKTPGDRRMDMHKRFFDAPIIIKVPGRKKPFIINRVLPAGKKI